MENENRGGLLRFILTLSFLLGTWVFFGAAKFTNAPAAKAGFIAIGVFSALAAAGVLLADLSKTRFMRETTKLSAALIPLSVNGGALGAEKLLLMEKESAAVFIAAVCGIILFVCCAVLVRRYRDDDL